MADDGEMHRELGALTAGLAAVQGDVGEIKCDQRRMWAGIESLRASSARIEQNLEARTNTDRIRRKTQQEPAAKTPWDKPMGTLAGEIATQALKVVGVGATVALILHYTGAIA